METGTIFAASRVASGGLIGVELLTPIPPQVPKHGISAGMANAHKVRATSFTDRRGDPDHLMMPESRFILVGG